jgi:3-hydroxyisobutyrate dehydrogenase-like beta-hydroxyacid dehydrogenase
MPQVSVIGTGSMGSALAHCLLKQGFEVTVWNRSGDKTAPLVEAGAKPADTVRQAVAASPLVLTCVKNHSTTLALMEPLGAALSGKTVFDLSTGGASEAIALVAELEAQGADYMLGMINAYPSDIGKDTTAILTVSSSDTWHNFGEVVRKLGGASQRVGSEAGALAALFAALFTTRQGFMFGMIHGALVCEKAEVPLQMFADQIPVSMKLMQDYYNLFRRTVPTGEYDGAEATLAVYTAALDDALGTFLECGAPSRLPQLMYDLAHDAIRDGYGDKQLTSLVEQMLK